jgi:hypothetical protein
VLSQRLNATSPPVSACGVATLPIKGREKLSA